jgi:hypothetical protein
MKGREVPGGLRFVDQGLNARERSGFVQSGGYDQGALFDRSATLGSPSFPEIAVPLASVFAPL